ncbi:BspA family leucine-rich repeat surface protein [Tessaracoccus sp. Y1736]
MHVAIRALARALACLLIGLLPVLFASTAQAAEPYSGLAGGVRAAASKATLEPGQVTIEQSGDVLRAIEGAWTPTPASFTYQWFLSGIKIRKATSQTYGPDAPGQYTVTVTGTLPRYAKTSASSSPYDFPAPLAPALNSLAPSAGPTSGGTEVTVTGSNLLGATGVSFGAAPGTNMVVDSDTSLRVLTPAHAAGVVDVTVTTLDGTATLASAFTFTQTVPPPGECADPMVLTIDTTAPDATTSIRFMVEGGTSPVSIDWGGAGTPSNTSGGPGQLQTFPTSPGEVTYTYSANGTYKVKLCGSVPHFMTNDNPNGLDKDETGLLRFFYTSLVAVDSFGSVGLNDLSYGFTNATNLASVPTILPSAVTSLSAAFQRSSFNSPNITTWNTANVTDMGAMFEMNHAFNQPIGSWNTANVTHMQSMFNGASAFDQPIGSWNTANVILMFEMFSGAYAFNQPLGGWNTSNVLNMSKMFSSASSFNQPLDTWNTANVKFMGYMFQVASSFNQPLGAWNVTGVVDDPFFGMSELLCGSGMSTTNYDSTLIGWAAQPVQSMVSLDACTIKYSSASAAARQSLITNHQWVITDGGQA